MGLRWSRRGTLAIALALVAAGAGAQRPPSPAHPAEAEAIARRFRATLREIDELLVAGEAQKAGKKAERLKHEMVDRLMTGAGVAAYLGHLTVFRALAAYQLGDRDEAVWHWQVANQLTPELGELTLGAYGEAGPFLKAHPPRTPPAPEQRDAGAAPGDGPAPEPPKVRKRPLPRFPPARLGTGPTVVVVEVVVGEDGRIREPVIVESGGEATMAYVVLDALREWELEPALLDGEPVEAFYNLTVNFRSAR
jgi:hypothetical protein